MLTWNFTWCEELTHLKRPWCWERLKVGGEGDDGGWDGWMTSPTQQTWVWVNSGSWWWTGRPGMLQSMGWQRVRHDWATELNWDLHTVYNIFTNSGRENRDCSISWTLFQIKKLVFTSVVKIQDLNPNFLISNAMSFPIWHLTFKKFTNYSLSHSFKRLYLLLLSYLGNYPSYRMFFPW